MRLVSLLLLAMLLPLPAFAQEMDDSIYNCKPRSATVEISFKPEVELKELLAWAVGFTCKRFVYDPRIVSTGKKVTLIAPGKQTPAQAYDMFTTALATMGYTVVPKGKLLQIVDSAYGKNIAPPIYRKGLPEDGEQVVRYVMRPRYAQPETLTKAVSAFKSDIGDVQAIGSLLIITDHASNIRDMDSIAKLVDVPGGSDGIYAIPVRHADATKLRDKLEQLLDVSSTAKVVATKGPAPSEVAHDSTLTPSKLLVDERTNTLIVAGTDAAYQRVSALVNRLDISLEVEGGTSMHVYQLGSAVAEELAKTLNEAVQQSQTTQADKKATAPGAAAADLSQVQGPVRVIPDKPTNKVLVVSSGRDFLAIRDVIRELDVPRRQVYIEALILEVQVGSGLNIGTASHGGYQFGNQSMLISGVQMPKLKSLPSAETGSYDSLGAASGLLGGLLGKTLEGSKELFGMSIPSYAILFQALADSSHTNILSSMPLIVVDNEEAKYRLGNNVPVIKGVIPTSPLSTTSQLTTNIERKDLVLELNVKPHISTDDSVLLEVKQSSEDLGESDPQLGPSWSTRSIETRVLVRDQQTIVLGGLIQNRESTSQSKVPLLGDIPLLGHLFKYTTKSRRKMNLLVMLTPYIVKDNLDLDRIRSRKQREYDEFAGSFGNLDGERYVPRLDYARKRGVVEEINRTVRDIEADIAARRGLPAPVYVKPGLVEPSASLDAGAQAAPTTARVELPRAPWLGMTSLLE